MFQSRTATKKDPLSTDELRILNDFPPKMWEMVGQKQGREKDTHETGLFLRFVKIQIYVCCFRN
jgi:hypothetical protein